jgi:uncharacterized protein
MACSTRSQVRAFARCRRDQPDRDSQSSANDERRSVMSVTTNGTEAIRGGYRRFTERDIDGVLAILSPEITWTIPGPEGLEGTYRGRAGVGEFFGKVAAAYEELNVNVDELLAAGDSVVALGRHTGRGPGGPFEVGFAHVWRTRAGEPVSFVEYTDTETLGAAIHT